MAINKNFFLGGVVDRNTGKLTEGKLEYDPANLTTHAVITGMTGSGKTGLGIIMLEEAALHGIPALIVDPKGDLTNLLLHFPDLLPSDFEPWIDPDLSGRLGKPLNTIAEETAQRWKQGLADWGLGREDLLALYSAAKYTIFTPGSTSGVPINILASFEAPEINWEENKEIIREKVSSTITALLGLIGLQDIDPLRSREHILLSNLLEMAWSKGQDLDLSELILQVQNPPIQRLGAFPIENFFPEKDRLNLAMLLNNFLASPSFQTWMEGETLNISALLYTPDGKPRHSIFYLAHLNENERMFFVTLLFAAVESWMRAQRGTSGLRAMLYFDEILGYLPPIANPPSRPILLRMLKQARAFGVGLILATQNPVDLDYKALSNCGTWAIGRLQTERDKLRLLDGLESLTGGINRSEFDKTISGLAKRVFLFHSVHEPAPRLLQTRWCLNYLAGPLTRTQIPALNQLPKAASPVSTLRGESATTPASAIPAAAVQAVQSQPITQAVSPREKSDFSTTRPAVPGAVTEFFLSNQLGVSEAMSAAQITMQTNLQPEGVLYRAALLAQAEARYSARKFNLDQIQKRSTLVFDLRGNLVTWDKWVWSEFTHDQLHADPLPQARFAAVPGFLMDERRLPAIQRDFIDWVYRTGTIQIQANEALKVYAGPDVSTAAFRDLCSDAARAMVEGEKNKVEAKYTPRIAALRQRVKQAELAVEEQKDEVDQRGLEQLGAIGELGLSLISKRKRSISTTLSKSRMKKQAQADLKELRQRLTALQEQLKDLEAERDEAIRQTQTNLAQVVGQISQVPLPLKKTDIYMEFFGVVWLPYYLVRVTNQLQEVPAFPRAMK